MWMLCLAAFAQLSHSVVLCCFYYYDYHIIITIIA